MGAVARFRQQHHMQEIAITPQCHECSQESRTKVGQSLVSNQMRNDAMIFRSIVTIFSSCQAAVRMRHGTLVCTTFLEPPLSQLSCDALPCVMAPVLASNKFATISRTLIMSIRVFPVRDLGNCSACVVDVF
eukprot:5829531-Amphidinium_carterae.1